jgi:hypothetical protein
MRKAAIDAAFPRVTFPSSLERKSWTFFLKVGSFFEAIETPPTESQPYFAKRKKISQVFFITHQNFGTTLHSSAKPNQIKVPKTVHAGSPPSFFSPSSVL